MKHTKQAGGGDFVGSDCGEALTDAVDEDEGGGLQAGRSCVDAAHVENAAVVVDEAFHAHRQLRYVRNRPLLPVSKLTPSR